MLNCNVFQDANIGTVEGDCLGLAAQAVAAKVALLCVAIC